MLVVYLLEAAGNGAFPSILNGLFIGCIVWHFCLLFGVHFYHLHFVFNGLDRRE